MAKIHLPFGRNGICAEIPDANLTGVYRSALPPPADDPDAEVERAMAHPFASPPLEELARGRKNAVIIASDHTRPVPSRHIIPAMLAALRRGNPALEITILIATGCHRRTSRAELAEKFGEAIVRREKIVVHDCGDDAALVSLGTLPSGGELKINRLAAETDLLVAEGFIEPHFFAGFSGGRKSVLPGIAARETVLANHCAEFIASPFARTGSLENNPIHRDMVFAAKQAKLTFIVNVVINGEKRIVRAFAGDTFAAHEAGCAFLKDECRVTVPESDIVITGNGGYPLDQNVYQCVKGMTAGEAVCRPGGVIILAADCSDGHGGEAFYRTLREAPSPAALLEKISAVGRGMTTPDQWQYQILARIMDRFTVIMVTGRANLPMIRAMGMEAAESMADALEKAFAITGKNATVAVIPDGVSVIAEKAAAADRRPIR